jgi:hypothetical protein
VVVTVSQPARNAQHQHVAGDAPTARNAIGAILQEAAVQQSRCVDSQLLRWISFTESSVKIGPERIPAESIGHRRRKTRSITVGIGKQSDFQKLTMQFGAQS